SSVVVITAAPWAEDVPTTSATENRKRWQRCFMSFSCWLGAQADLVALEFGEPQRAVRPQRDAVGVAGARRGRKFGDELRRRASRPAERNRRSGDSRGRSNE